MNDEESESQRRSGAKRDIRYGHDPSEVQDANGVDLLLLERNLRLSVEERLKSLEERHRFLHAIHQRRPSP